ncbi:MAG: DUF4838 domain-containing protein [Candidatus Anammoximicrobium sp.]|nr:DUF4838 domain-containing protein [Candidatus Anammoximicrobium sp.]
MKHLVPFLVLFSWFAADRSASAAAPPLVLARDRHSEFAIVLGACPSEAERFAAEELAAFLQRGTGAELPIVAESEYSGGRGIFLGPTALAAKHGMDAADWGEEEWGVRAVDGQLIVTGGRPRGTLYGVYELLERVGGVRFLDAQTEHVPRRDAWTVPADLSLRGQPAFSRREIGWTRGQPFEVRCRMNSCSNAWREIEAKYGYGVKYGSPYTTHTHHRYVADWPDLFDQPEFFALTQHGRRDTQVCMSHPEVRRRFGVALRRYIDKDRRAIQDAGTGAPFPRYYSLVPDDGSSGKCYCERCLALADRHGSYAGIVLDFANAIAEDLAREHPDVVLVTSAYTYYRDIPRGIRPRENVMVRIAQLGAEFNTAPKRDTLRSMLHPLNAGARAEWEAWSKLGSRLDVHDYWGPWGQQMVWPYVNVRGTAETVRFYHEHGLQHFFVEASLSSHRFYSFPDLQYYVGARLLLDPRQPVEPLIDEFLTLYYGPAAAAMRRLLEYLERRQAEESGMLATVPPHSRAYLDRAFFLQTDALLGEAESKAGGDPAVMARVRQERLPLDETMLFLWDALAHQGDWPFSRQAVADRLEGLYAAAYVKYGGRSEARVAADRARLAYLRELPPLPPRFAGRRIVDLCGPLLTLASGAGRPVPRGRAADSEAALGQAWRIEDHVWTESRPAHHERPPEFGLSDTLQTPKFLVRRVLQPSEIPADEQYHWHYVGRMQATPTMYFYAHHSWVFDQRLLAAYNAALPEQKHYDAYLSLKLEGPAYVNGSTRRNAFSIDRLILVETGPGEPPL